MCIKFGIDSSSRFPFRVQTDRHRDTETDRHTHKLTDATHCLSHALAMPAWDNKKNDH